MTTAEQLAEQLGIETLHWLRLARPLFHQAARKSPKVSVRHDLRGASAGQVRMQRDGSLVIRYNLAMAAGQPEAFIAQTVPHEVAHVVTHVCHGRVRPHGAEWRRVMAWFGFDDPARCHDFELAAGKTYRQRRWHYRCACTAHQLSTTRHNRAQRGLAYTCRACGTPLQYQPTPEPAG